MTQQEFNAKATELIKAMVNAIADKDFSRLATSIPPKLSWAHQIDAERLYWFRQMAGGAVGTVGRGLREKVCGGPFRFRTSRQY